MTKIHGLAPGSGRALFRAGPASRRLGAKRRRKFSVSLPLDFSVRTNAFPLLFLSPPTHSFIRSSGERERVVGARPLAYLLLVARRFCTFTAGIGIGIGLAGSIAGRS
jgi:hypothetical protein